MRRSRISLALLFALSSSVHGQRLSDWLLSRPKDPDSYPLGLVWETPGEKIPQNEIRFDLLESLNDPRLKADPEAVKRMKKWIASMPVTGRVPLASGNALWLAAHPDRDPVLSPGDTVFMPHRPESVTVVDSSGNLCRVRHEAGLHAGDYVERCGAGEGVDWTYVAQPDGRVMKYGIALWNDQEQDEPAPGAWIWAPDREFSEEFSGKLISFLATQGPAPDSASRLTPHASPLTPYSSRLTPRDLPVTANDWGEAGLLQTPTARMRKEGDLSFTLSRVYPYTRGNMFFQPFSWMEAGFRYTNISNHLYGASIAGTQAYKDKSIDVKLGLLDETAWLPQVGVGLRDVTGTGLFSGEYLVGSKRTGPFDWSLGLGWGYVGARGDIPNPVGKLIPSFDARQLSVGQGGNFSFGTYFHGPSALFGGVQYQTPWDPLIVKIEYDGNNYQHEPFNNNLLQNSPWNFGAVYRAGDSVDLSFGLERGNTAMFGLTLHTAMSKVWTPKLDDPPRVPVLPERPKGSPDWSKTGKGIETQTNWHVEKISRRDHDVTVTVDDARDTYWKDYLDRAVSVLHRDAPESVDNFRFVYREKGIPVAEHDVDRSAWVEKRTQFVPPSEQQNEVVAKAPEAEPQGVELFRSDPPMFDPHLGMNFNYLLGGPNGFVLYQFAPTASATLSFDKDTWLQGGVQLDVLDNYNKFTYDAPSNLPRVRTYLREYMTTSRFTMPNLQLTHVGQLSENQYWSVYGGYLEMMFAGVGGEWLYRPFAGRAAFGVDVNEVQQRDFAQNFNLRNYRVLTGHGTLYWDTGWQDVLAKLSVGRYLAGDIGTTIDFSRVFKNGVKVGGYFTRTNVSAAQFGEGSFDKGIYLQIPFDAILTKSSDTVGNFLWEPLYRDGGAKLMRAVQLYDVTSARDPRTLQYEPAPLPNDMVQPEERREEWKPGLDVPQPAVHPKPTSSQWRSGAFEEKLVMALYGKGFRNIGASMDGGGRLAVSLENGDLHPESLAVGRAARIILAHAPLDAREIVVTLNERGAPAVSYDFFDLAKLKSFFEGRISGKELGNDVKIDYFDPTVMQNDPFSGFEDMKPRQTSFSQAFLPDQRIVPRVERDVAGAAGIAAQTDWLTTGAIGAGLVLGSSLFDRGANSFALKHGSNSMVKDFDAVGNALPWLESGGVALAALGSSDPRLSRAGYASSEAAVASYVMVIGLKYAVGRARPWTGHTNGNFSPFAGSASRGQDSFPSGHAIVSWSVITPFAMEYNAPWLYGLGVITDISRVGSRNHWVSDVVAGSFLGYGMGKFFWESSKENDGPHVFLMPYGAGLSWNLP